MFDIAFEMAKDRGGITSVYVEAAVQNCFLKRCHEKFRRIHKKHLSWNLFFDKVILCRPATLQKTSL